MIHGGDALAFAREKKIDVGEVLDFSANINPYGIHPTIVRALQEEITHLVHYPDVRYQRLREDIAKKVKVQPQEVFLANGAAAMLYHCMQAMGRPVHALLPVPSFLEYERAVQAVEGSKISYYEMDGDFQVKEDILTQIDHNIDVFILCNPNNPTGKQVDAKLLDKIVKKCEQEEIVFILDECFLDFVLEGRRYSMTESLSKNLVILGSFTKYYAIPGLRLGYAICKNAHLAERIEAVTPEWSVNHLAVKAGEVALEEVGNYLNLEEIHKQREYLFRKLQNFGFDVIPSTANFLLFYSKDSLLDKKLQEKNILIRNCSNYRGLGVGWFRIAVRLPRENQKLIGAIEEIWQKQS